MRVLLIGTYQPLLKALKQGLEEEDFLVDVANQDHEGNGKLPATDYDVIVLDLRRHEATHLSKLQRWHSAGLVTPVLALTVPGSVDDLDALDAEVDDFLTKPFHLEELLRRLRALGRRP